ncbi:MAG: NAD(P)/FAD-dependent oxidoreductase [Clostridia bacterium]|nr:NAD(P)/FAD-dependent oxidoreductase [Clostridia bacterium]
MTDRTVVIIGGGAAGLMTCGIAKNRAKKVILIDKNDILGKKLRITGKGRCNVTNALPINKFFENIPTNSKFLYSAFSNFTNQDMIGLLNELGVPTKVERGERVFPESDRAKDVADALVKFAKGNNVHMIKAKALEIIIENGAVSAVKTDKGVFSADSVILATGGASYPLTGSDGSGYKIAKKLGHTITPIKPSLVPLVTKEKWVRDLMGLTLKNVSLHIFDENGKKIYTDFGEMLFTHFGVSGPIILSASAHIKDKMPCMAHIDLKPALDTGTLDKRIIRDFEKFSKKHLVNSLEELLPKALIPVIISLAGLEPHKETSSVSKEERKRLLNIIKALPVTISGTRPIEEAIITSGGVAVSEINPKTMESRIVKGLYFAGEIIDVDAYTGGFNLQIAFSTGVLAGENA